MIIKVPASTANLGPGFDSLGMAVSLYLEVEVLNISDRFQVDHVMPDIPHDENNLIVKTALTVYPGLPPLHLQVKSNIPLAHGLGSSSSAIAAGIELANHFDTIKAPLPDFSLVAYAPEYNLPTKKSRNVLPAQLDLKNCNPWFSYCQHFSS